MSAPNQSDSDSLLDEKAAEWLIERSEGFAPGRAEAFVVWCNQDARNAGAVARVEQALVLLDELPFERERVTQRFGRTRPQPVMVRRSFMRAGTYWAAGLAAALVLSFAWRSYSSAPIAEMHASTAAGPRRVALSDGSVLDLNASSNVRVEFSKGERRISLTAGEGFFKVAHDTSRPFVVTANGVSVRAVGTAFNVRLIGDKVEVLVTEGKVEVDQVRASDGQVKSLVPVLSVGEATRISPAVNIPPQVEEVAPESMRDLLVWQNRMSSFTNVPLSEMITRLNRCNSIKLTLDDPALGDRRIGGTIDLSQVNAFIRMLEQDGDIVAEQHSETEIGLRRAR